MNIFTTIAIVVSAVVVLLALSKISRQLDNITALFKSMDKKLAAGKSQEDMTSSQILDHLHDLEQKIKIAIGDIDWKG